jgi:hypothetical protein
MLLRQDDGEDRTLTPVSRAALDGSQPGTVALLWIVTREIESRSGAPIRGFVRVR